MDLGRRDLAAVPVVHYPPGPNDSWLVEAMLHVEDIRRPLGLHQHDPVEAVSQVADFYKGSILVMGARNRVAGVRLRATGTGWSHGAGPEVAGPRWRAGPLTCCWP